MKQVELTKEKHALVDDQDWALVNQYKWHANRGENTWYAATRLPEVAGKRKLLYMHRLITGAPEGMSVDHINHNGLDNRRNNLRICTHVQNCANRIDRIERDITKYLDDEKQIFGGVLLASRINLEWTYADAAKFFDTTEKAYEEWENGKYEPDVTTQCDILCKICHFLARNLDISRRDTRSILVNLEEILEKNKILLLRNNKRKRQNVTPNPKVKELSKQFYEMHKFYRGYPLSINYGAWGTVIQRLLATYTPNTINQVMKAFFETPGRTKTSIYDFEKGFGNVCGYLNDKAKGERS